MVGLGDPLGDPLGIPWGPPWDPGPEIDDSEIYFRAYLTPRASNLSQNRRSGRPRGTSPSYIV